MQETLGVSLCDCEEQERRHKKETILVQGPLIPLLRDLTRVRDLLEKTEVHLTLQRREGEELVKAERQRGGEERRKQQEQD